MPCASIDPKRSAERSAHLAGFTLLEVLAAVALIGLAYVTLGEVGIQGLRYEGEAHRRLSASLLADGAIADLEQQIELGTVPAPGREERQEGPFRIEIVVAPWTPPLPAAAPGAQSESGEARAPARQDPQPSLLGGQGSADSPLRRLDVAVHWTEGVLEREVRRTTFAFDPESVRGLLDQLDQAAQAEQGETL